MEKDLKPFAKKKNEKFSVESFYVLAEWIINHPDKTKEIFAKKKNWTERLEEIIKEIKVDKKIVKELLNADLKKIDGLKPKNLVVLFEKVFVSCKKHRQPQTNQYKVCENLDLSIFAKADLVLKLLEKKEPVAISYNANLLYDRKLKSSSLNETQNHSSIIVGKRVRNKHCEFLIKNSWGDYCDYDWECQKDQNGKEIGVWVNSFDLMLHTPSFFYLEDRRISCS